MPSFNKLCNPAKFYFILSAIAYLFIVAQNVGVGNKYTLGMYSMNYASPTLVLVYQAAYIVFWTWLLNIICTVNKSISWIIVLFPFILFFIATGIFLVKGIQADMREGFHPGADMIQQS